MKRSNSVFAFFATATLVAQAGCDNDDPTGEDPDRAAIVMVDRFQDGFATLFKRSGPVFDPVNVQPNIPAPNAPIDFDRLFTVNAFGPAGENVIYYSLDIVPPTAGKAWLLLDTGGAAIAGQLPIIEKKPGDAGYNDFVRISEVRVGGDYVANTITSKAEVDAAVAAGDATVTETTRIADWGLVPAGSIATRKFAGKPVTGNRAWLDGSVAHYLAFEDNLIATADNQVPTSGIVVIFKNNMSPAEGFETEPGGKTHNAVETLPGQPGYSSYWSHSVGDRAGFAGVTDFASATANVMAANVGVIVNCPIVTP